MGKISYFDQNIAFVQKIIAFVSMKQFVQEIAQNGRQLTPVLSVDKHCEASFSLVKR
jgi:hypothetical protein